MKNCKNTHSLNDDDKYILYNVANYKFKIDNDVQDILGTVVSAILEYMQLISEKITMKNKRNYKFIFERGLETLLHVFSVIFYYTKNLELTFYHTQKSYYYYIEFIEQISDDNVTFLHLNSKDAVLFVYKKTIFQLNNDYKNQITEPNNDDKQILTIVDKYTQIYKRIVKFIINHNDFNYDTKINYIFVSCDAISKLSKTLNNTKIIKMYIDYIYLFTNLIADKNIDIRIFFNLIEEFTKRIYNSKKKFVDTVMKQKINDLEINNFISNNELNKMVEYIFT